MSLIDVSFEDDVVMLARIVDETENGYNVNLLVPTRNSDYYRFEKDKTFVEFESVCGVYDTDDVTAAGYAEEIGGLYSVLDSDYSDAESDDSFQSV